MAMETEENQPFSYGQFDEAQPSFESEIGGPRMSRQTFRSPTDHDNQTIAFALVVFDIS
jgi:hypothetical protein